MSTLSSKSGSCSMSGCSFSEEVVTIKLYHYPFHSMQLELAVQRRSLDQTAAQEDGGHFLKLYAAPKCGRITKAGHSWAG